MTAGPAAGHSGGDSSVPANPGRMIRATAPSTPPGGSQTAVDGALAEIMGRQRAYHLAAVPAQQSYREPYQTGRNTSPFGR